MNSRPFLDKIMTTNFVLQLNNLKQIRNSIISSLVSGVSVDIARPMLLSEMRRIIPTAAGLPLELSLVTAAVMGANVRGGRKLILET